MDFVTNRNVLENIQSELQKGTRLDKCRKCGCMRGALEILASSPSEMQSVDSPDLIKDIKLWLSQMEPTEYSCLGCNYCFPAVAMNVFDEAFPEVAQAQSLCCDSEVQEQTWPPVPGEYSVLCSDSTCPVAASTLMSVELAEALANQRPDGLCIVGKTETENIGIEKVIRNTITNPTIRFLLLAGKESRGHHPGGTFLALGENGVDENMRVIDSPGKRPVLRNATRDEVEAFRGQVQIVDMIGCDDVKAIVARIEDLSENASCSCGCQSCAEPAETTQVSTAPIIQAAPIIINSSTSSRAEMPEACISQLSKMPGLRI
jgi:tetrahydromethanopterin S-methyltransferase subunit A